MDARLPTKFPAPPKSFDNELKVLEVAGVRFVHYIFGFMLKGEDKTHILLSYSVMNTHTHFHIIYPRMFL